MSTISLTQNRKISTSILNIILSSLIRSPSSIPNIPLKEISQQEELSQKYLESITRLLSKNHLIEAASGHGGGYRLTREPEEYSVGEILKLTEGTLAPVSCLKDDSVPCDRSELCYTLPIWQGLADLINNYFDNMTLEDVAKGAVGQTGATQDQK